MAAVERASTDCRVVIASVVLGKRGNADRSIEFPSLLVPLSVTTRAKGFQGKCANSGIAAVTAVTEKGPNANSRAEEAAGGEHESERSYCCIAASVIDLKRLDTNSDIETASGIASERRCTGCGIPTAVDDL